MGLAGNMKLSTFVAAGACATVLGGTGLFLVWPDKPPAEDPPAHSPEPTTAVAPTASPQTTAASVDEGPAPDALTQELLSWNGKDLGSLKKKDVSSGQLYKINVYQDEGHATANRAKVDLDRDDKWDLKIDYGETITRQVSTQDDEVYDLETFWTGKEWEVEGSRTVTTTTTTTPLVLTWMGKDLGAPKLKDVTKGEPYKINVYQDEGHATANRAKVDRDRDDKWDVTVTFGDPPSRKVSTQDDEVYDLEEIWNGTEWVSP